MLTTSQNPDSLATLRLRMEDLERGTRIKGLRAEKARREGRRVTQQSMADAVGVTLRAAQEWEYGGGIDEEHLPVLIDFLETDADYLLRGRTPDLMGKLSENGTVDDLGERLERIEVALNALLDFARRVDPESAAESLEQAQLAEGVRIAEAEAARHAESVARQTAKRTHAESG